MILELVNLTAHEVKLIRRTGYGPPMVIRPSGRVVRCDMHKQVATLSHGGRKVNAQCWRVLQVPGMPDPKPGVGYIVSAVVANALPDRSDLFVPHSVVRQYGKVIGCRTLIQYNTRPEEDGDA